MLDDSLAASVSVWSELPRQVEELQRWIRRHSVPWQDVLWFVGLGVAAVVIGRVVAALFNRAICRWARHTSTKLDDAVAAHIPRPLRWLFPLILLRFALPFMGGGDVLQDWLHHAVLVGIIVVSGWLCFRGIRVLEDVVVHSYDLNAANNLEARAVHTQMKGFRNIAGFVVVMLTIGFALLTFDAVRELGAGLLASAGVAGIVLGFAAQKSISTVLAGIQIAIAQPIKVDDVVIVEGEWGRIEEITLTYVSVRIWDLRRLIVPINYFIEKPFQNWTRVSSELLAPVYLYLDYDVPVDSIREELQRIVTDHPKWDGKVCGVQVTDSSEQTMTVRALVSAGDAGLAWELRCDVREKLIDFVRRNYPDALPRLRAELRSSGERAA